MGDEDGKCNVMYESPKTSLQILQEATEAKAWHTQGCRESRICPK